jgi:serine/threonine-protein kinase 19
MSKKRKAELICETNKKLKGYNLNEMLDTINQNDMNTAFMYLKKIFPRNSFPDLPVLIYVNQLYSLIKNKTYVDRNLEILKKENKIILFTCDSGNFEKPDVCICEKSEFNDYVKKLSKQRQEILTNTQKDRFDFLIDFFINKILNEVLTLSISSKILKNYYELNDKDLTCLVQFGLLVIKDSDHFWVSVPGVAQFRQDLINARLYFRSLIRKKKVSLIKLFIFII